MHPLVFDVAYAIHGQAGGAFLQQYGPYSDPFLFCLRVGVGQVKFTHVVDQTAD